MSRAIFRISLLVGLLVLVFSTALFFALRYTQAKDETYVALRQEAVYAEQGLMQGGEDYLRSLGDINRITWIRPDGSVLFDNEFPNEGSQFDCPEVSPRCARRSFPSRRRCGPWCSRRS